MKWYGYRLKNGQLYLCHLSDSKTIAADELREAKNSSFVDKVFGPIITETRQEALMELKKLAAAQTPGSPKKKIYHVAIESAGWVRAIFDGPQGNLPHHTQSPMTLKEARRRVQEAMASAATKAALIVRIVERYGYPDPKPPADDKYHCCGKFIRNDRDRRNHNDVYHHEVKS